MKVFLAGYEIHNTSYGVVLPPRANVFMTFAFPELIQKVIPIMQEREGLLVIDSGAHNFFRYFGLSAVSHIKDAPVEEMPDPLEYFEKYLAWLKENHHLLDYFVELDLQEIVGYDQVEEWRSILKKEGLFEKCITVYHSPDGFDKYEKLVAGSESRYIGIEGIRVGSPMLPYKKLIRHAYENKCRVHGFAFTRQRLLLKFPFYSVDSTSWTTPIRYGTLYKFDKGRMISLPCTKDNFFGHNINVDLHSSNIKKEFCVKKDLFMAEQYFKPEDYFTDLWNRRGVQWDRILEQK